MKRLLLMVFLIAAVAIGCSKEEESQPELVIKYENTTTTSTGFIDLFSVPMFDATPSDIGWTYMDTVTGVRRKSGTPKNIGTAEIKVYSENKRSYLQVIRSADNVHGDCLIGAGIVINGTGVNAPVYHFVY